MAEKLFYSMGEVAEMFDVKPSLIRHWESQFASIKPVRNKKGNRLFTPRDVEQLKLIYHLVKEQGMTLEGARKALRHRRQEDAVPRDVELMERLQRIRSLLVEVREELKAEAGEIVSNASDVSEASVTVTETASAAETCEERPASGVQEAPRRGRRKAVVRIADPDADPDAAAENTADGAGKRPGARRPRRKKEDAETKELFAFYEQSLF